MNIDKLTHASICLDNALEEVFKGNTEKAQEYIRKAKKVWSGLNEVQNNATNGSLYFTRTSNYVRRKTISNRESKRPIW